MFDVQLPGSFLIGGLLLLTILNLNQEILETSSLNSLGTMAQENAVEIITIIQYDFEKIGYSVPNISALLSFTDSTVTFLSDIDQDTDIDTIAYRLGSTGEVENTENPNDRYLYRAVNNEEHDIGLGLTEWELSYYTASGNITNQADSVRIIGLSFTVETMFGYDNTYGKATWESQIAPKNLGAI